MKLASRRITVEGDFEEVNDLFYANQWTDGLPVVPPTPQRVEAMLRHADRDPQEVLGLLAPKWLEATVENIAINAVMAGCRPEYFPVVVAATEAILDPAFNANTVQASTTPITPCLIVNGPIAEELDINCRHNVLGQGWRANATIGRAIRLILLNIGGGLPGELDMATQGQPAKFTCCLAENERESPWEPLHVERAFRPEESTVTATAILGLTNVSDFSERAEEVLESYASAMTNLGSPNYFNGGEPVWLIGPQHAQQFTAQGFSKAKVKEWLFEHTKMPLGRFSPKARAFIARRRVKEFDRISDDTLIPLAFNADSILIVVAGAMGDNSIYMPTFGQSLSVTKPVRLPRDSR
ncbi:MAG: hypothetical protein HYX89_01000 [Chloroflexi bacterium]|nr:hypothetical protein [Chloroflexota bacterium]